jgi:hypothetical protein
MVESSFYITIVFSIAVSLLFFILQFKYFRETRKYCNLFYDFFYKESEYEVIKEDVDGNQIQQLKLVGEQESDLNKLLSEVNHYVAKTKGTTDFAVIQNKVERMLTMRYEQSEAKLAFPTYLGLMGTFLGVLMGIFMFIWGFDGQGDVRDDAIKNLLTGILVSMSTSFIGLLLTTINNAFISEAKKGVEEDKNEFYDFVQTELMPSLDVSLVVAISKLHETVDKFEPAFNGVIRRFQDTFDRCTKAFGESFETNVKTVSKAVEVMGKNMDKINENIQLQQNVLSTFKSDEVAKGLEKYVEAADHFVGITQSLNKFEEARRMMLAATQEAINYQNQYADWLQIPREIAVRVNDILNRIKNFEENIERIGVKLAEREILGNDVVNAISDQVNAIEKKSKIADKYLQLADGQLEDLFKEQTAVIDQMNHRYRAAIQGHIDGFEEMIDDLTRELERRHNLFIAAMEEKLNINVIREEFSNLKKLGAIFEEVKGISDDVSRSNDILISINRKQDVSEKADSKNQQKVNEYIERDLQSREEVRKLRQENEGLNKDVKDLKEQISHLLSEVQRQKELRYERTYRPAYQQDPPRPAVQPNDVASTPSSVGRFSFDSQPHVTIPQENPEQPDNTTTNESVDDNTDSTEDNGEEIKSKKRFNLFSIFRKKKS